MKTAFIGHRRVLAKNINEKLVETIEAQIQNGCKSFTMGAHGEFDGLALSACKNLRNKYKDIDIEVVLTSLHTIKKQYEFDIAPFSDVKTVMYEIEDVHFKRQITKSNQMMIDTCDTLICYVDKNAYRSGAKKAMLYAEKRELKIINLYREEDQPFYGMTKEEIDSYLKAEFEKLKL